MNFLQNNARSIYIHIPFCIKKCNYCAFVSFSNIADYEELYVKALIEEINSYTSYNAIETLYFGGGTPNLLNLKSYEKIFCALNKNFKFSDNNEITMEFNPKISDLSYMKTVKSFGVNRISLGVQSFQDKTLKILGRLHHAKEAFEAIENIKNSGIENFSIDLMYGIFEQKINDLKKDLQVIKTIEPKHISTYGLKIEENTPFYNFDKTYLPDEDTCAEMYLLICEELSNYNHYEISNFAKNSFEAKHNVTYWKNREYFAFGPAAHGYLNNTRFKHTNDLIEYIKNPTNIQIISANSKRDNLEETIFLGLRLKEGINLTEIKNEFDVNLYEKRKLFINNLIESGHVILNNDILQLTEKGFLISNYILAELISI